MHSEWIPININSEMPLEKPFLLSDDYGNVYTGSTAFEFYEATYWFPMPKYPFSHVTITNDEWVNLVLKKNDHFRDATE